MRKPNFFMLGGPKCGTTSLQEYLASNTSIFMCTPKEPCYFDSDVPFPTSIRDEDEYRNLFRRANEGHIAIGEASTNYLYSQTAIAKILQFSPDARFIVMVRNPMDMAHSMHADSYRSLVEDVPSFQDAWALQEERRHGRRIPNPAFPRNVYLYGDCCKLGEQLQRLYQAVSREKVLVIVLDDLRADPRATYRAALTFLGVPDDNRECFPARNSFAAPRSRAVRDIAASLMVIRDRIPVRKRLGLISAVKRMNNKSGRRPPLPPEFRRELSVYFRQDVELLSSLVDRDLMGWLDEAQTSAVVGMGRGANGLGVSS